MPDRLVDRKPEMRGMKNEIILARLDGGRGDFFMRFGGGLLDLVLIRILLDVFEASALREYEERAFGEFAFGGIGDDGLSRGIDAGNLLPDLRAFAGGEIFL